MQGEQNIRKAVIVSYARTGPAKAARSGFNNRPNMTILAAIVAMCIGGGMGAAELSEVY
ncbi:MAG TPA: hypothetical protein VII49_07155 [Rhizomicrobium sp.]